MRIKSLIVILMLMLMMPGCSKMKEELDAGLTASAIDSEKPELKEEQGESAPSGLTVPDALELCLDLLGKTDEESTQYFDGGEANYTADKSYLIGRNYHTRVFDEAASVYTSYSQDGKVDLVIIELKDQEQPPEYYAKALEAFLEQSPSSDGGHGDDGSAAFMWEKGEKLVYLYDAAGKITIQMLLPTEM